MAMTNLTSMTTHPRPRRPRSSRRCRPTRRRMAHVVFEAIVALLALVALLAFSHCVLAAGSHSTQSTQSIRSMSTSSTPSTISTPSTPSTISTSSSQSTVSTASTPSILIAGSLNLDTFLPISRFPRPGENIMTIERNRGVEGSGDVARRGGGEGVLVDVPGGKGCNQAVACGRLRRLSRLSRSAGRASVSSQADPPSAISESGASIEPRETSQSSEPTPPSIYFLGQFGNDPPATLSILQNALTSNGVDISLCGYSTEYRCGRGYVLIVERDDDGNEEDDKGGLDSSEGSVSGASGSDSSGGSNSSGGSVCAVVSGGSNLHGWSEWSEEHSYNDNNSNDDQLTNLLQSKSISLLLLQCEIPESVNLRLARAANAANTRNNHPHRNTRIPVFLDAGGEDRIMDPELLRRCDFLIPNESELERLARRYDDYADCADYGDDADYGVNDCDANGNELSGELSKTMSDALKQIQTQIGPSLHLPSILRSVRTLQRNGANHILVTLGARGSLLVLKESNEVNKSNKLNQPVEANELRPAFGLPSASRMPNDSMTTTMQTRPTRPTTPMPPMRPRKQTILYQPPVPLPPNAQVVDETGAGDCYRAGFAIAFLEQFVHGKDDTGGSGGSGDSGDIGDTGDTDDRNDRNHDRETHRKKHRETHIEKLRRCMKFASAAGALAVTKKGAVPSIPSREEVDSWLECVDRMEPMGGAKTEDGAEAKEDIDRMAKEHSGSDGSISTAGSASSIESVSSIHKMEKEVQTTVDSISRGGDQDPHDFNNSNGSNDSTDSNDQDFPLLFGSRLNSMKDRLDLLPPNSPMATPQDFVRRQALIKGLTCVDFNYPQHFYTYDIAEPTTDTATTTTTTTDQPGQPDQIDQPGQHDQPIQLKFRKTHEYWTPLQARHHLHQHHLQPGALCLRYPAKFARGAMNPPDPQMRREAIELTKSAARAALQLGCKEVVVWSAYDGYDYPLQVDHDQKWKELVEAFQECCDAFPNIKWSLEYKPTDENTRFFTVPSTGAALLLVQDINRPNMGLTLDVGHMLMSGENPAQSISLVGSRNKLFGIQLNDGYTRLAAEDGMMFGSIHPSMALELMYVLRKLYEEGRFGGHLYFDTFPQRTDPVREGEWNIERVKMFWRGAGRLLGLEGEEREGLKLELERVMREHDAIGALELVDEVLRQ